MPVCISPIKKKREREYFNALYQDHELFKNAYELKVDVEAKYWIS